MFKLVVLCAFLAAATADPSGAFYAQPLTYSSTVISPAVTTISKSASSVVHPSPTYYYSTPSVYSHFIKKRGAPFYFPTTYAAGSPLLATSYSTPILHSTPLVASTPLISTPIAAAPFGYPAAHLIKKRSAPLISTTAYSAYSPLTYSTPLISHTPLISAAPYYSSSILSHAPLAIPHLIKKRSAPILTSAYIAPTSYSHQSRIDYRAPLVSHYTAPLAYQSPYAYSHVL
ncbi:cuticle protein 16.5-like [Cydia pomonella]|uniref:cuticle protein 16.5-like n=1 Tax=Cydia pomonella TaxID=82600 RepID=UPI002ADE6F5B|nr:cuticle protein 16.5-like [Cydia pomonella]XP_061715244.1 cuticle protein 16.5-like [Cydia pomonella]